MPRRLLAFTLSAVLLGAPMAAAVCQGTWAARDAAHGGAMPAHHACHESAMPAGTAMTAALHPCGHTDDLPTGLDQPRQEVAALAFVVLCVTIQACAFRDRGHSVLDIDPSPPGALTVASPLRL